MFVLAVRFARRGAASGPRPGALLALLAPLIGDSPVLASPGGDRGDGGFELPCGYAITTILPPPPNGLQIFLDDMNDAGVAVGAYLIGFNEQACLWTKEGGIQTLPKPWWATTSHAHRINNNGWILVNGSGQKTRGYILIPAPEGGYEIVELDPASSPGQSKVYGINEATAGRTHTQISGMRLRRSRTSSSATSTSGSPPVNTSRSSSRASEERSSFDPAFASTAGSREDRRAKRSSRSADPTTTSPSSTANSSIRASMSLPRAARPGRETATPPTLALAVMTKSAVVPCARSLHRAATRGGTTSASD